MQSDFAFLCQVIMAKRRRRQASRSVRRGAKRKTKRRVTKKGYRRKRLNILSRWPHRPMFRS